MKFQQRKGNRIKRYGFFRMDAVSEDGYTYWYVDKIKKWFTLEDLGKMEFDEYSNCYSDKMSLKSAIRKIKKSNVPKGTKFVLQSRFIGYDIEIIKK